MRLVLVLLSFFFLNINSSFSQAKVSKPFTQENLAAWSATLEKQLQRDYPVPAKPITVELLIRDAGLALNANQGAKGLDLAQQAAMIAPNTSQPWRVIARAALSIDTKDYNEKQAFITKAMAASYLGYQRANTPVDEALALSFLSQSYEKNEAFKDALRLLRMAVALDARPERVKRYEELRDKYGFRVTNHSILSDQVTPASCFTFSENLKPDLDYTPFITISGQKGDFAITKEERQICVEGLKQGEKYTITLRQGLPSVLADESLRRTLEYQIYVRDRAPTLRFTGRNYVLPAVGLLGIPLLSINVTKAELDLLRIGDRNLINSVHSADFLGQNDSETIKKITEEQGQKIWSGSVEVKSDLNKEVTTAVPIQEVIGKLQPGLYMLSARPNIKGTVIDDDYSTIAAQWFIISDIGITTFKGNDGVHILAKSLATAKPIAGSSVRLLAKNNEVLATLTTDQQGYAKFDAGLSKGKGGLALGLVTASLNDDYAFLDLKQSAFDFSGRGLVGRTPPQGLDAFIATERGVYRGGETVFATVLLRDSRAKAVEGLPVTVIVKRPDGVEFKRETIPDAGAGGRAFVLPLTKTLPTGLWRMRVHLDAKADPLGETSFLVEDYVPEKLDLMLTAKDSLLRIGKQTTVSMAVKYLFGAAGADLTTEGTITIKPSSEGIIPNFAGFSYGLIDEKYEANVKEIEDAPRTDLKGNADFKIDITSPTIRPLEAEIVLKAGEPGGRFIARTVKLPILPDETVLGIKKRFKAGELEEGKNADFDVALISTQNKFAAGDAEWKLVRITTNYQWYFSEGRWSYETTKEALRVSSGKVQLSTDKAAQLSVPVKWGNYRLELKSGALESAVTFSVGDEIERTADAPDMLDVNLDKSSVLSGHKIKVTIASRFTGKASLVLLSDKLTVLREIDLSDKGTTVELEANSQWNTSNWLAVIAHRPLDTAAKRQPGRAIGLAHIAVDKEPKTINVTMQVPKIQRPNMDMIVPIKVNAIAGEEVYLTLAAVDAGILNLTKYQSPDPVGQYYGARLPAFETRDLYGYLIDGMQGVKGILRSGGDQIANKGTEGDVPDNPPVAYYSGVLKADAQGEVRVSLPIPAFNGTLKLMATVWSKERVGQASNEVVIRDPIVMTSTLPRFLNYGDQTRIHVSFNNVEGQAGDYSFTIKPHGPVLMQISDVSRTIKLEKGGKAQLTLPINVTGVGKAHFDIKLSSPQLTISETRTITVNPSALPLSRRTIQPLAENGRFIVTKDLLNDFVTETASVAVSVTPNVAFDVPALMRQLISYPYACSEQTVSSAMPLLYTPAQVGLFDELEKKERIEAAINRLVARQSANGSFGLWSVPSVDDEGDLWLDAYIADFLTRAKEKGYVVQTVAFDNSLDRLRNKFVNTNDFIDSDSAGLAYAAFVLASNGRPILGDLRYINDTKMNLFKTPFAKGQIGAALSLLGDRVRATQAFTQAVNFAQNEKETTFSRQDYGSLLRDTAGLVSLMSNANADNTLLTRLLSQVEQLRGSRITSTQESMWLVLAANALQKEAQAITLKVNDNAVAGGFSGVFKPVTLSEKPLTIENTGKAPLRMVVSASGVPLKPEPARSQGFTIERIIYNQKGDKVDPQSIKANSRYIIVLKATEAKPQFGRVIMANHIPSGFEIENVKLTDGAGLENYSWLEPTDKPVFSESRDDRFIAAFDREDNSPKTFSAAFMVRAVTPGRFTDPASLVEDMYRPDRYATTASGTLVISP